MKDTFTTTINEGALSTFIKDVNDNHHKEYGHVLFTDDAIARIAKLIYEEQRKDHRFEDLVFNPNAYYYDGKDECDFYRSLYHSLGKGEYFMFIAINNNGGIGTTLKSSECTSSDFYNDVLKCNFSSTDVAAIISCDRYEIPGYEPNIFLRMYYNKNYEENKKNCEIVYALKDEAEKMMREKTYDFGEGISNLGSKISLPNVSQIPTIEENLVKTFEYLTTLMHNDTDKYDYKELSKKTIDDIVNTINNTGVELIHRITFIGFNYDITKLFSSNNIIAYGLVGYDNKANPLLRIEKIVRDELGYPMDSKELIKATIEYTKNESNKWYALYVLFKEEDGTVTLTFTIY